MEPMENRNQPESRDLDTSGQTPDTPNASGQGTQSRNQNTQSNQTDSQKYWKPLALSLAACLVIVAGLAFSGVLGNRGGSEAAGTSMTPPSESVQAAGGVPEEAEALPEESADTGASDTAQSADETKENVEAEENGEGFAILQSMDSAEEDAEAEEAVPTPTPVPATPTPTPVPETPAPAKSAPDASAAEQTQNAPVRSAADKNTASGDNTTPSDDNTTSDSVDNNPAPHNAELTLPAAAAPLFSGIEPAEETADGDWYAFSPEEYGVLLEQLDGAGFIWRNDVKIPDLDTIYIFVES